MMSATRFLSDRKIALVWLTAGALSDGWIPNICLRTLTELPLCQLYFTSKNFLPERNGWFNPS